MSGRARAVAVALVLLSCSGASIRGGQIARVGREPTGQLIGAYATDGCSDARKAPAAYASSVSVVKEASGEMLLIERRPRYDSIVITNFFIESAELVFQVQTKRAGGPSVLHDFRLPIHKTGPGRMALATSWREKRFEADRFRAYFDVPALSCRLVPAPSLRPARGKNEHALGERRFVGYEPTVPRNDDLPLSEQL